MSDGKDQLEVTVRLVDGCTAGRADLRVPYMDAGPSAETRSSSEELAAEQTEAKETEVLAPGCVIADNDSAPESNESWLACLLGIWATLICCSGGNQSETGETLVTRCSLRLTIVGFFLFILDMGTDIGTSFYFARNGQWWQAMATLAFVYGAVIIHTGWKWAFEETPCPGAADWLRYVASSLVNWPNVKQYRELCRLEWKMHQSPAKSAHLVPEWDERRASVALLKLTEGACEACPQAMLQLCLLVPDLYGAWTWTDYFRIAGAFVSLCTAGAALVNLEKYDNTDVPLCELVVLHVWAVPVTVSRLLSVALLLSVHPYWALAGVALHLVLPGILWCIIGEGDPRTLTEVIPICLLALQFTISPFIVVDSVTSRRVLHAIHFLGNTAATVVWALGTPLVYTHLALYTAIICFNAVMFAVGLVAMELHMKYWPKS